VRRAAWIPAWIDGGEAHLTVGISELRAAQEALSAGRDSVVALAAITRIHAVTVGVPEIDAGAFQPCAIFDGSDPQGERKRRTAPSFGNVGAHELRVEIERTFRGLRREDAYLGAGERGGKALFRREALARGEAEAERCRGAGQGLAAHQPSRFLSPVLAHDVSRGDHRNVTASCLALSLSRIMASMREALMPAIARLSILGFVGGALAVLVFHQIL